MSRRSLAALAALTLLFSVLVITPAAAVPRDIGAQFEQAEATVAVENPFKNETAGFWIVRLDGDAVATYEGGLSGFAPTSPRATGEARLNARSPEARAYSGYLADQQTDLLSRMEQAFARSVVPRFQYTNALNGFSVWLTPDEAAKVARMPGVANIQKSQLKELTTDYGPAWIGAPAIWDGTATGVATQGEGIIVGVIDSGINWQNPSFADVGFDGYDHTNPFGAGNYVGVCNPAEPTFDATFMCNDKLIGAWNFFASDDMTAIDHDGHGSHTSSTAAGNVTEATLVAPTLSVTTMISGVAPHANIISYRVCGDADLGQGSCEGDAIVAAIEQAILDGVDVINYSIGSPTPTDPWTQADDLAFLAARTAGINVAHSAGNEGPDPATSGSPNAPWMSHVAALTHDRQYINFVQNLTGGDTAPPADIQGLGFTSGYGPAPIVYAGNFPSALTDTPELCGVGDIGDNISPWPAGTFSGEIVVCRRGTFGRVEKGANVLAAGAGGFVLVDNGGGLVGDPHELPGVHITQADGDVLIDWLNSGSGHMAEISGAVLDVADANGDRLAGFSSRGPNPEADWLMPSMGAPGVDIIAAHGKYGDVVWTFSSGTSMASPHVAGSMALLQSLHPDWTPAEIQSALMTTAKTDVFDENGDPADPFDVGNGRVQIDLAAQAGLIMDETEADYLAADPSIGGDPTQLNLPSLFNQQCVLECEFHRTVTSSLDVPMGWTASTSGEGGITIDVSPANFTLDPGASQDLVITIDVSAAASDVFHFGEVTLTPGDASVPEAHFAAAVQPTTGELPDDVHITTRRNAGSWPVTGLTALEITEFTTTIEGLTKADITMGSLFEDSDNSSAYDDPTDGGQTVLVDVDPGSTTFYAEILTSEAPDLDLRVGLDDGDGIPEAAEEVCISASGTALESCVIDLPAPGTYWVHVQNWGGSDDQPDAFELATAVLDGSDAGNMTVEGPATQPQLEPFDVRVFFDLPDAMPGERYYGAFSLGTDAANPGNLGTVPVRLDRLADDVTKTVSASEASPFDILTYTIEIAPNSTPENLTYTIEDTIPAGLTYVPGSATATEGTVSVVGNTLHYEGVSPSPAQSDAVYQMSTNLDNPSCDTGFGGYVDLESLAGFGTDPGVSGDTMVWTVFDGQPVDFYGGTFTGINFTDDGFLVFDPATNYGGEPWVPQLLPDPTVPNNLAAIIWQDYEIFYDAATNAGVTAAQIPGLLTIIEYDNIQPWGGGPDLLDFEIVMLYEVDDTPGVPEIVFAYDNVAFTFPTTVGVENQDGSQAVALLNQEDSAGTIDSGLQVCFDWAGPSFDPITISYDVQVNLDAPEGIVTNAVVHSTDNPGSVPGETSVDVEIVNPSPADLKGIAKAILEGIDRTGVSAIDSLRLDEAIDKIDRSLNPDYWADEFLLDPDSGRAVFYLEGGAATRLMRIRATSPAYGDVQNALELMLLADMKLAQTMIDLAKLGGGHPFFIARAEAMMDLANESAALGRPDRAIRQYGIAWHLANVLVNGPSRIR